MGLFVVEHLDAVFQRAELGIGGGQIDGDFGRDMTGGGERG